MIYIEFAYAFPRIRLCVGVNMYEIWGTMEFEVVILFLPAHFREKRVLKNLRGRIQKILIALNWKLNSDSKYIHMS